MTGGNIWKSFSV